jgi:hypothetical protein
LVFQIEIFWRRALFADNNRVHCLVNADLLDYEVSDKGERTLERLMKNAESKGIKFAFYYMYNYIQNLYIVICMFCSFVFLAHMPEVCHKLSHLNLLLCNR